MDDTRNKAISGLLARMKFRKKLIGGVDELDVWKKIETLQEEYERQLDLQAQKYQAIIDHLEKGDKKDV
ncbi:MAG: hypothetical protein Q4E50_04345 [Tissierellia bacterium]|nr:hypothetical protein [Tissierellia bacterium]